MTWFLPFMNETQRYTQHKFVLFYDKAFIQDWNTHFTHLMLRSEIKF